MNLFQLFIKKPEAGEIWEISDCSPFAETRPRLRVLEIRGGWVRFSCLKQDNTEWGDPNLPTTSKMDNFLSNYRLKHRQILATETNPIDRTGAGI